jgi:hypothetical protein
MSPMAGGGGGVFASGSQLAACRPQRRQGPIKYHTHAQVRVAGCVIYDMCTLQQSVRDAA